MDGNIVSGNEGKADIEPHQTPNAGLFFVIKRTHV
jgi:hypothetical protein